ncbi:Nickel import ATP-binding protein NikD [Fundidesulfovibrio magnetotacticus]|uniref:Nickel import ATP-binding protein NikD n=1 Tax=Fundidesulfovibrio magnetotacticus TaxID=2730080 RepID=A0A6V8LIR9_9BACT|nr:ABC transporter ATP-binding protein [Fundidesulfovibrio magnetotacticus]GFK92642.1 Nickel import ATP-binding protein NikD [Fundidesulfovibrio magnetotacticus]
MDIERLLEIEELRVETAGAAPRELVRGVSLHVAPGEVLGLVGASGSGKSLTCLSVMDLLPSGLRRAGGRVRVSGRETVRRGLDAAMVLQNPSSCFDPVMTVRGHFKETLKAQGTGWARGAARAEESLAEAGFEEPGAILGLYPFQMSGGMLQRVAVALAMLGGPRLLLADEPTTDLDMPAQAKVLDLIDRLRRARGLGVLLVTHDLSVVARLADRVAVMQDGRLVETGPVSRVFEAPSHPYARTLLAAHLELHEAFEARSGTEAGTGERTGEAA